MLLETMLAFALVPVAQEAPDDAPEAAPAAGLDRVHELETEFTSLRRKLYEEIEALKPLPDARREAETQKLAAAFDESAIRITHQIVEIAKQDPKSDVALGAVGTALGMRLEGDDRKAALAILDEHHALGQGMVAIVPKLQFVGGKEVDALLHKVIERNPSRDAKGLACFQLAMRTRNERDRDRILTRCTEEFADVASPDGTTVGELAGRELRALRVLKIGRVAPEIEGKDMDGVAFKLSDYRGKVVVIDFWGYW